MRYYVEAYVNGKWVVIWTGTSYTEAVQEAKKISQSKIKEEGTSCSN